MNHPTGFLPVAGGSTIGTCLFTSGLWLSGVGGRLTGRCCCEVLGVHLDVIEPSDTLAVRSTSRRVLSVVRCMADRTRGRIAAPICCRKSKNGGELRGAVAEYRTYRERQDPITCRFGQGAFISGLRPVTNSNAPDFYDCVSHLYCDSMLSCGL